MSNISPIYHYLANTGSNQKQQQLIYDGVTITWLLATLGGKNNSNMRSFKYNTNSNDNNSTGSNNHIGNQIRVSKMPNNIKKKDIIKVCIPKICEVIENTNKELSLKYVSNLMYGVTICYDKKTEFLLDDLNNMTSQLNRLTNSVRFFHSKGNHTGLTRSKNIIRRLPRPNNGVVTDRSIFENYTENATLNNAPPPSSNNVNANNTGIFNDDPKFNINYIFDITSILREDNGNIDASLIKRTDLLNELTNSNNADTLSTTTATANVTSRSLENKNDRLLDLKYHSNNSIHGSLSLNNPLMVDDIPFDIDFDLDVNEFGSQHGTSKSDTNSKTSDSSFVADYGGNFDINVNIEESEKIADLSNMNLELEENESENTKIPNDISLVTGESELNRERNNRVKRNSKRNLNVMHIKYITFDEKTNYSTDRLRSNFESYNSIMIEKNMLRDRINCQTNHMHNKLVKLIENISFESSVMQECYTSLFNKSLQRQVLPKLNISFKRKKEFLDQETESIERGRKRLRPFGLSSRSSSLSSQEKGRRLDLSKRNISFENDDLVEYDADGGLNDENNSRNELLNLEQIDEELESNYNRDSIRNNSGSWNSSRNAERDLMRIDLNIPPSSFGRQHSRAESANLGSEMDVIEELQAKTEQRGEKYIIENKLLDEVEEEHSTHEITNETPCVEGKESVESQEKVDVGSTILDQQSRKFYEYINSRAEIMGRNTFSNPPFERKLLFEDIIPSTLSEEDAEEKVISVSHKIAANAFLSLLNLVSRGLVDLQEYENSEIKSETNFNALNGDDIIVFI
ncbi:hypothetical protein TBLA_0C05290 [Henningerozyma blattae CBS 6284]|uniref:Rad21/Rec8-like protein N-terminal domain-containing protein n=1 Tax=Henningerozyma blattae (strain ATCC 34711 / CBS 6284 / DSM 70876 / NBRC 10599 / NRRL Y-10934 / UCD 77-7) TaxID=1071380 RepID=I2H1S3_HENB6|nr:hypothetical protein TBLA_0C05290 [Tetrapisispora blattae CBS 6284]CCH60325.1 hypothetical protein TBLA_0C05290 [Tetrapisispora blattae CBS 6284]